MADNVAVGKLVGGRYRVARRLGAGGMGTVYVAVQEPLGREVALKVVRRDLSGDEKTVERFRREAMTLSQAHHPHIVTLLDFGEMESSDGGALYFAMELVPGQNLRQRLQQRGPMPVKKTLTVVRDIASALAAAHALGIIHRDLKPDNVLLMEATGNPDFVKILDFGVAKLVREDEGAADQEQLTQRGSVVGTPGYIAPEVALRGVTTDARSDLYALGVLWFECLAGHPPFRARTATALLMAHALDPVPSLPDAIPLPVAGLVQRLLAKSPEDRPESAEELQALIDALPPFDSGVGMPRPNVTPLAWVEASAATINDAARPRTPHAPSPMMPSPPTGETEASMATEISARPPPAPAPDAPSSAAAITVAPARSLVAPAALIAVAIVVAAVIIALFALRHPDGTSGPAAPTAARDAGASPAGPHDAGAAGVVDAGAASLPDGRDAGAAAPSAAHDVGDAGAAPSDAGHHPRLRHPRSDEPPKHHEAPHPPDIWD